MLVVCPSCQKENRVPAARLDQRARCGACKTAILPLRGPLPLGSSEEFDELIQRSPLPVLVDFWAAWCGPCRAVAPQLEQLAGAQAGHVVVAKVDTDALSAVAARFGIRSIPTMILFRGGREERRIAGAMPADAIARNLGI